MRIGPTVSLALRYEAHDDELLRGELVDLRPANRGFSKDEMVRRFAWSKDEDLQYWSGNIPTAKSMEEYERVLPERDWPRDGRRRSYGILERPGHLIGMVSCYAIDWNARTAELGVYIGDRTRLGRGLGTDAIRTLVEHAFCDLGIRCISLNTFATNHRAIRSYTKVGFQPITLRRRFRPSIGYYREVRMELDRSDYLDARARPFPAHAGRVSSF